MNAYPSARVTVVQEILTEERQAANAERERLQDLVNDLVRERAVLIAERDRLAKELRSLQSTSRQWHLLQTCQGGLAEELADRIEVRLEEYQDDRSGRQAICLAAEEITLDLSEDDYVPSTVIVAKSLSPAETVRFRCRLQAESLRYTVERV